MNTIQLRTRTLNVESSSSSSPPISWTPKRTVASARGWRPAFVSSPAPKRSQPRLQRAA